MRSSQIQISTAPVSSPIAARTGGRSQPCSTEYLRKKIAASTSAMPAIAAKSLTPMKLSQSNAGAAGLGGVMGGGGGGGGGGSMTTSSGTGTGSGSGATKTGSGMGTGTDSGTGSGSGGGGGAGAG